MYAFLCLFAGLFASFSAYAGQAPQLRGMVLAGADFGANALPGTYGKDYFYPSESEVDYFVSQRGMGVIRIPFRWERLQPAAGGLLDTTELARLDSVVGYVTSRGASALIDPHNYARYYDIRIGDGWLSSATFADFWSKLALHYKGNSRVIFGLMNEPHDIATEVWLGAAQAATNAIRQAGASNLILVPGNAWSGAWSWTQNYYGTANSVAMLGFVDPGENYAFEVHQYLDGDSSGTAPNCVGAQAGSQRLATFTDWARSHGKRAFLGEFAGGVNDTCLAAVSDMIDYLGANSDVYLGWTWWASGPWWGNYMFSLEPSNTATAPMANLIWSKLGGAH